MDIQKRNLQLSLHNNRYLLDKIFFKDNNLEFIFKKTEKVCMAVYLVTNFFVPEEPLKWSLRKSANDVLNSVLSYNSSSLSLREKSLMDLHSGILSLVSYFDLAFNSGFVSPMNYEVMAREINLLIKQIEDFNLNSFSASKRLFSDNYFEIEDNKKDETNILKDNIPEDNNIKDNHEETNNYLKRQNIETKHEFKGQIVDGNNNPQVPNKRLESPKLKSVNLKRQDKIISEIRKHESVSIKDILRVLPNYSSKTLQRELIRMVEEGILEKTGERRWSRYSLKNS